MMSADTWCGFCTYDGPALAASLRELRENVLLGLGMTAVDVAAMDDELADSTIRYLLSGHGELAAEVERLERRWQQIEVIADTNSTYGDPGISLIQKIAVAYHRGYRDGEEIEHVNNEANNAALRAQLDGDVFVNVNGTEYRYYPGEWRPAPPPVGCPAPPQG